jgi:deuterolysin
MKGFTQICLAALAAYVSATAINVDKRASPLSVVLTASGNSEVKVAVTNNGDKALNLLSKGTFLDEVNPVEKVTMYAAGGSKSRPLLVLRTPLNWVFVFARQGRLCVGEGTRYGHNALAE